MKKMSITCLFIITSYISFTQYVSFSQQELQLLNTHIASDSFYLDAYKRLLKIAQYSITLKPNAIEKIRTSGKLQGDPEKIATIASIKDFKYIFSLALAYKIQQQDIYLKKALQYLISWAEMNHPSGSPIDDTNLEPAIAAFDLIKNDISLHNKKIIKRWLYHTAVAEVNNLKLLPCFETGKNNWNSHRLKVVGMIAYTINHKKLQKWTIEQLEQHLAVNLRADSTSLDFHLRDALHYHVYDLEPLIRLSIVIHRATGKDYYRYISEQKSSIEKSIAWLLPYTQGKKFHKEFIHSTVKFDRQRAANKETTYETGKLFNPRDAYYVFTLSSYFTGRDLLNINNTTLPFSYSRYVRLMLYK